jgi:ornithine carbamoyltransferase
MWENCTERLRRIIFLAQDEAIRYAQRDVDTEHLLLALSREPESTAQKVLARLGIPLEQVRLDLERNALRGNSPHGHELQLTNGAQRAISLAFEASQRLGDAHAGTEHLLIGLVGEVAGLAARTLRGLGAEPELVLRELSELRAQAPKTAESELEPAPPVYTQPRVAPEIRFHEGRRMWDRLDVGSRMAMLLSQAEAAKQQAQAVELEHLLLGLTRDANGPAAWLLTRMGISLERLRAYVGETRGPDRAEPGGELPLSPRAKRAVDLAYEEARMMNAPEVGPEHLLLGLIREEQGLPARVLVRMGARLERVRVMVQALGGIPSDLPAEASAASRPAHFGMLRAELKLRMQESAGARVASVEAPPLPTMSGLQLLRELAAIDLAGVESGIAEEVATGAVHVARQLCRPLPHLRGIEDLGTASAWALLALGRILKSTLYADKRSHRNLLSRRTLALLFEKPSLRTRVSFETGMFQLGGCAVHLAPSEVGMGKREPVADVARNLAGMVDVIVPRVFAHATVRSLADHSSVPVINGLCDREHPCQALADFLTIWESRGGIAGQRVAYVGDGNNVAHSLLWLGAKLGARVVLACPPGYEPDPGIVALAQTDAEASGGDVRVTYDPEEACTEADVIYTDVWVSMGQEDEASERAAVFQPFQVNAELVSRARPDYIFMHCLPAHRGDEVTAEVMDGPHSVVFEQSENRLHAQKAALTVMVG